MKKLFFFTAMLLMQTMMFAQNYCLPDASDPSNVYITKFFTTNFQIDTWSSYKDPGYSNFTNVGIADANLGLTLNWFNAEFNRELGYNMAGYLAIWIDFNKNGSFSDPNEMVRFIEFNQDFSYPGISSSIEVPMCAQLGVTRMRIRIVEGSTIPNPCSLENFGETEDYTVNVVDPNPEGENPVEYVREFETDPNPTYFSFYENDYMHITFNSFRFAGVGFVGKINKETGIASAYHQGWAGPLLGGVFVDHNNYIYLPAADRYIVLGYKAWEAFGPYQHPYSYTRLKGAVEDPSTNLSYILDGNRLIVTQSPHSKYTWGDQIFGNGHLENPVGITVSQDYIYVSDVDGIEIFNKSNGTWIARLDQVLEAGTGVSYVFNDPKDLTFRNGIIYVADAGNNRIVKFTEDGVYAGSFNGTETMGRETTGQLIAPFGVRVSPEGEIFVSDMGNNRIQVFKEKTCEELQASQRKGIDNYNTATQKMEVFPNPSAGNFNVSLPENGTYDMTLINSLGVEVMKENFSGNNFDFSNELIENGVYTLRVNGDKKFKPARIIISK